MITLHLDSLEKFQDGRDVIDEQQTSYRAHLPGLSTLLGALLATSLLGDGLLRGLRGHDGLLLSDDSLGSHGF